MLVKLFLVVSFSLGVFGGGEVIFMTKSSSMGFRGHEQCDADVVKDIISISLGYTPYPTSDWSGLYIDTPFNFCHAVAVLAVVGVSSLCLNEGHKFPFVSDTSMEDIWTTIETKTSDRYLYDANQSVVKLNLEEDVGEVEISLNKGNLHLAKPNASSSLKEEDDTDKSFLDQIALLNAVLDKIESEKALDNGLPDLFWINFKALHPIIDIYGENSKTGTEAKELVISSIHRMKNVFEKKYPEKVLFMVLTSDAAHTRRFRRASELDSDRNLAPVYDENYPVFFNIFLWFTIAFIMAIIATSMVTACMDPGRDSIIYRMTSTRMKKDN